MTLQEKQLGEKNRTGFIVGMIITGALLISSFTGMIDVGFDAKGIAALLAGGGSHGGTGDCLSKV